MGKLLINGACQDHRCRARRPLAAKPGQGHEHGRHGSFHVTRSPAVQPSFMDSRSEGIDRHPIGRHRVLVNVEKKGSPRVRRLELGQQVISAGSNRLPATGNASLGEPRLQIMAQAGL